MAEIEEAVMTNPFGTEDTCGKITSFGEVYILQGIVDEAVPYSFSIWILPEEAGNFQCIIGDEELSESIPAGIWTKLTHTTVTAVDPAAYPDVKMYFPLGTVYIYHAMLEKSSTGSDWRPNPDDTDAEMDVIYEEISKSYTNATKTANEIMLEAVKEYVRTEDLETFKQQISTQFVQSSESIEMIFSRLTEQIKELEGDTTSEFSEIKKYIRFVDGSIVLGQEDNPLVLTLENNRISFTSGGVEVAYFSNNQMYVSSIVVKEYADICGLKITKDDNGDVFIS